MNAEAFFLRLFQGITRGHLTFRLPDGSVHLFGKEGTGPTATMNVTKSDVAPRILRGGAMGMGETYMDGGWNTGDHSLTDLLGLFVMNDFRKQVHVSPGFVLQYLLHRYATRPTSKELSKSNVSAHYDLSNDFYKLMLDSSMTYSCGYQLQPTDTIEQLQEQKYRLISSKLQLHGGDTLVDIGCGWGGMLIHAAKNHGVKGVGVTLSVEQRQLALERVQEAGLSDRITIELKDYRDLQGTFTKFVSIGMFEHVGKANYRTFMQKTNELLAPGGLGLLHTIGTVAAPRKPEDAWFLKYIFPGSRLPRLFEMVEEMQKHDLLIGHAENLKLHYAVTLRHWKNKTDGNRAAIQALGSRFDDRFLRMWDYYLQGAEAGFRYGNMQLYQVLFCKGKQWTLPMRLKFEGQ